MALQDANIAIEQAGNIPDAVRAAIEHMLGREVSADEEIKIIASTAIPEPQFQR
jgi:hypothetical protein